MAPSQLAQLKSALAGAGLNRQSKKGGSKQTGKAGLTNKDREKKQNKLNAIKETLNKFDVRETKVKNPVVGRVKDVKGLSGTPSQSRQRGLEMRRETLLPELQLRRSGHTGTFVDRRFGESNPNITPEERALERFTRTRDAERGRAGRKGIFNLNDEDSSGLGFGADDGDLHLGASNAGFTLTHGGRAVDDLKGDDFMTQGLGDEDELEDDFGINREVEGEEGAVERDLTRRNNFGGFGDEPNDDPDRKRSKNEIMQEVIAKSKSYKLERQQQKELDEDMRMELDEGLDDLRELLAESAPKGKMKSNLDFYKAPVAEQEKSADNKKSEQEKIDYDQYVRSLAFDRRAKPKDRTKTEEETVKEEAEKLQEAEAARLKRMRGEVDEDEDEEEAEGRRRRRNTGEKSRKPEADDLDDDYMDGSEDGDAKEFGLGDGLGARQAVLKEDGSEVDNEEEDEDEDDEDEDEEDEDEDDDLEEEADDLDDLASEMDEEDVASEEDVEAATSRLTKKSTLKSKGKGKSVKKEIPFTFKCPESYEDFLEIVEGLDDEDVETVVKRIRTLYHPSLGEGNKERLQGLLGILLEHVVQATPVQESMNLVTLLAPHINALVALNPLTAAEHFKSMLAEMHEILMEELANSKSTESTFPDLGELAVLRMIGTLWSTSDFSHPVSVPAALYMGQNLSQGRVKGLGDIAAGLFMAAIFLQYEAYSKKIVPEALNFVAFSILALAPSSLILDPVPGSFPLVQLKGIKNNNLIQIQRKQATGLAARTADLPSLLNADDLEGIELEQAKVDLMGLALKLVGKFAEMHEGTDAFGEVYEPFFEIVFALSGSKVPAGVKALCEEETNKLGKMLSVAGKHRRPLEMQTHKAIPIPQYAPKFDVEYSRGKRVDPDAERNEAAKLKSMYKKERKGAIRELRKDAKFLAVEKAKERKEKDEGYEKRMRSVVGSIATTERAEEKAAEREKARDKRRGGRK